MQIDEDDTPLGLLGVPLDEDLLPTPDSDSKEETSADLDLDIDLDS